jgi:glutamate N-acetyltransferase/amino-acid N-acetyltransferase
VLAAAGSCGVEFDPARARLSFGPVKDAIVVVEGGARAAYDEGAAAERLRRDPVEMRLELGPGPGSAIVWTCDFSAEYVSINADYTT